MQPAEELHGHYLLPFIWTEDGTAPGEAQECQSEGTAIISSGQNESGSNHPLTFVTLQFDDLQCSRHGTRELTPWRSFG